MTQNEPIVVKPTGIKNLVKTRKLTKKLQQRTNRIDNGGDRASRIHLESKNLKCNNEERQ